MYYLHVLLACITCQYDFIGSQQINIYLFKVQLQKMSEKQRLCHCCNISVRNAVAYKPLVHSVKENDTILLHQNKTSQSNKINNICAQCKNELQQVETLVKENNLKFGNGSAKGREAVSIYFDFTQTYINTLSVTSSNQKKANRQNSPTSFKREDQSMRKSNDQQQSERQSETIETTQYDLQDSYSSASKFPISFSHALLNSYSGYNPEYQPFYNQTIEKIIKNEQLFKSNILPINYRYLLFLCTSDIPTSERHQRIRSTLLRVMVGHAIPLCQIKNASILIQILLCFMRDAEVYIMCGKILEQFQNHQNNQHQYDEDQIIQQKQKGQPNKNQSHFWEDLYSIPKCFQILQFISQLCREGAQVLQKYSSREHGPVMSNLPKKIRKSNNIGASQIVYYDKNNQRDQKQSFNFPIQSMQSQQKRFSRRHSVFKEQSESVFTSFNGQIQSNNQLGCPYCNGKFKDNHGQTLKQIERMKNYCSLIIKSIGIEQEKYKQYIKQLQSRFKKEKDQYITKILNLKGKLNIQTKKQNKLFVLGEDGKSQIGSDQQCNEIDMITMVDCKKVQQEKPFHILNAHKSMGFAQKYFNYDKATYEKVGNQGKVQIKKFQVRAQKTPQDQSQSHTNSLDVALQRQNQCKLKQKQSQVQAKHKDIGIETQLSDNQILVTKKQYQTLQRSSQKQEQILLTYLNRIIIQTQILPLPEVILSPQDFLQNIINQVNRVVQQNVQLLVKNKQSQSETRRLISIIQRKQEKFVPLMYQKDQLIQTYQNALWRLQNGLSMNGNKLADRIHLIQKLEKQRKEEKQKAKKKQNDSFIHVITKTQSKSKINQKKQEVSLQKRPKAQNSLKNSQEEQLRKSLNIKKKVKKTKTSKTGKSSKQEQAQVQSEPKQKTLFSSKKEKDSSKENCIIY